MPGECLVWCLAVARRERVGGVAVSCCARAGPLSIPCTSLIYPLSIPCPWFVLLRGLRQPQRAPAEPSPKFDSIGWAIIQAKSRLPENSLSAAGARQGARLFTAAMLCPASRAGRVSQCAPTVSRKPSKRGQSRRFAACGLTHRSKCAQGTKHLDRLSPLSASCDRAVVKIKAVRLRPGEGLGRGGTWRGGAGSGLGGCSVME